MTEYRRFITEFDRHANALLDAATQAGPDTQVPTCGSWVMRDLVGHVSTLHRWVVDLTTLTPEDKAAAMETPPEDYAELLDRARANAAALTARLTDLGPEHACKAFRWSPQNTAFWARRQAHEIAIHRLDAELAIGGEPGALYPPELAADGIAELLLAMVPGLAPRREPVAVRGTVLFAPSDSERSWLAHLEPGEPVRITEESTGTADASMTGTAETVFRAVWGRPNTAVTTGDPGLFEPLRSP
ncbi:maleylpyruvate isomerase family mycothiol-dependent enzyme [Sciscionella sediminilitoris]|uniref:maleylpyruvate isomerase family mycothiol-dependent enzyme n=1 Tax=Sciscionella sediminilitoris TaxID=1445613 RepID=UPI00068E1B95|nr:maleylpyruvate isomerase family mycothiol-dependent enzyme [Sciscionella sp. SE31]